MSDKKLEGKVALVAGGSRNLGREICEALSSEGAAVVVHYNRSSSKAEADETVKALKDGGGKAVALQADLTRVPEIVKLFDEAARQFGGLDIAVNTAGKVLKKPIVETTEDEFDEMFAVNTTAAYFFIREAAKRLRDGGKIVSIGTSLLAAFTGLYSTYAGAKAPLEHFTRAAAKELGARGISVNAPWATPATTSARSSRSPESTPGTSGIR